MDPLYAFHAGWLTPPAPPAASPTKLIDTISDHHHQHAVIKDYATVAFDLTSFLPYLQTRRQQQYLAVQDHKPVGSFDVIHSYASVSHRILTSNKHTTVNIQSQLLASYTCLDYLLSIGVQRRLRVRHQNLSLHCDLISGSLPGIGVGISHQHTIQADDNRPDVNLSSAASLILTSDGVAADLSCKLTSQQYGSVQLTERVQPISRQSQLLSVVSGAHYVTLSKYSRPAHVAWSCATSSSSLRVTHASCGVQLPLQSHSHTELATSQQSNTSQPASQTMLPIHHAFLHTDYHATPSTHSTSPTISISYGIGIGNIQHQLQGGVLLSTSGVGMTFAYNTVHNRLAVPVLLSNEISTRAIMAVALLIPSICYCGIKLLYAPIKRRQTMKQRQALYTTQHERWQQHHTIALLFQQAMTHRMQTHQNQYADKQHLTVVTATYGRHWNDDRVTDDMKPKLTSPLDVTIPCQYFIDDKSHTLYFSTRSKANLPGFAPVEPLSPELQHRSKHLPPVELHITYKCHGVEHTAVFNDTDRVWLP